MPAKTLERPKKQRPLATAQAKKAGTVTAFAIVKAAIGQNLWQLATYTIDGDNVTHVEHSVEDLREILISKIPDLIGGFL